MDKMKNINAFSDVLPNISPVWNRSNLIIPERGEGSYLYDVEGNRYLDFTCGIGVTNTGHCHPKVVEAIRKQAGLLLHGQINIMVHQPMLDLVRELKTVVPSWMDGFFFTNSGAEAVEGAIKLARQATGRPNIIVFQGSFHGRTVGTMSLTTSKTIYRSGYQPLMPGVVVAPFPYAYRYGWDMEKTSQWCLEELETLLISQSAPFETAAMLIEPVLGEGGYVVPPASFLKGLREICNREKIMLIADEVQSGFGRTGRWFAHEHFDVKPDIMVIAKGLGSGMPISGVVSPLDMMKKWIPGSHGGTYGGNAVAAAAATATVQAIREEKMLDNTLARGKQLMEGLKDLQAEFPVVGDVRGLGLMIGVEFRNAQHKPDAATVKAVLQACFERKLMLLGCGTWNNTVRFIPPLNVKADEIDQGLKIFAESLKTVIK
jgi:4-aminobutyrate aminotransferase